MCIRFVAGLLLISTTVALVPASTASSRTQDAIDSAIRQLRAAVVPQRDGSHLLLLSSLRQLRDPDMRPFFHRLLNHAEWQVQVHAVLGLAEVDDAGMMDSWLLTQIDPRAQEAVLTNALDGGHLSEEQMFELARWDDVEPMVRLLLTAELVLRGNELEPVDETLLNRLAGNPDLKLAGLSSALLTQIGTDGVFSPFADRIAGLSAQARQRQLGWLLEAIGQFKLTRLTDWVETLVGATEHPKIRAQAVLTLLRLAPEHGVPAWRNALGETPSYLDQVRYTMLMLGSGHEPPGAVFDRLTGDDPLLHAMVEAGRTDQPDRAGALIQLVKLGHVQSSEWALHRAADLPPADAVRVYAHVIQAADREGNRRGDPGRAERAALAVTATARLFDIDPARVTHLLSSATDDGQMQQTILLGLFETTSPLAGDAATTVRRIGSGQTDSLALLLIAKHHDQISDADLEQLSLIARGGGRVSTVLQMQACWLLLSHSNRFDRALAEAFSDAADH